MRKTCCGFGHRDVCKNIENEVYEAVLSAIAQGCTEFLTGDMGSFDNIFASAVRKAKADNPSIRLICVKPYVTKEMKCEKELYSERFDEIVIPEVCRETHPKWAITRRNRWMVDNSDFVLTYVITGYGGAYAAKEYAARRGKTIIEV